MRGAFGHRRDSLHDNYRARRRSACAVRRLCRHPESRFFTGADYDCRRHCADRRRFRVHDHDVHRAVQHELGEVYLRALKRQRVGVFVEGDAIEKLTYVVA